MNTRWIFYKGQERTIQEAAKESGVIAKTLYNRIYAEWPLERMFSKPPKRHGLTRTRFHGVWKGMKTRCLNPNADNWERYGGKGVTVCKRWLKFKNFYDDMFPLYKEGLTIDRIDNKKGYSPKNCRWITTAEQNRNRDYTLKYTIEGKESTIKELSKLYNIDPGALYCRVKNYGCTIEEALTLDTISLRRRRRHAKSNRTDTK